MEKYTFLEYQVIGYGVTLLNTVSGEIYKLDKDSGKYRKDGVIDREDIIYAMDAIKNSNLCLFTRAFNDIKDATFDMEV